MRRRPQVELSHQPAILQPGGDFALHLELLSRAPTSVRLVTLTYRCVENVCWRDAGGHLDRNWVHHRVFENWNVGTLVGRHSYDARFAVPAWLPGSYEGVNLHIRHELQVHIDIPWWPDYRATYLLPAIKPVPSQPIEPRVYQVPRPDGTILEGSLRNQELTPGAVVEGQFSQSKLKMRELTLALVGTEELLDEGRGVDVWCSQKVRVPRPPDGESLRFSLRIPDSAPCSSESDHTAFRWYVEVAAEKGWSHWTLRMPFRLHRVPQAAVPSLAPSVGRERRNQLWTAVAERLGLTFDEPMDRLRRDWPNVSLVMGQEPDPRLGYRMAARLSWPTLGLELQLRPRGLHFLFNAREINLGDALLARFEVSGHEAAQVRALLNHTVRLLLSRFAELELDDQGARCWSTTPGDHPEALYQFAFASIRLAEAFDETMAQLPARAVLQPWVLGWRRLAARLQARFEPGRVCVHDGHLGSDRVSVETLWDGDQVTGTRIRLSLQPPLPQTPELASAPPLAQTLWRQFDEEHEWSLTSGAIELNLPLAALDPSGLEPQIERAARLALALRGIAESGPYR